MVITTGTGERIGEAACTRLEGRFQNRVIATEHLGFQKGGLYRFRHDGVDLEPPLLLIPSQPKPRENWTTRFKYGDKSVSVDCESDTETLTVAAGTYHCFVIRLAAADSQLSSTVWYAPRVGMVKQSIKEGDQSITLVLERFERVADKEPRGKGSQRKSGQ